MNPQLFEYEGELYPTFLRDGNAAQFAAPFAAHFCKGTGLDVGCGKWPMPGMIPVDIKDGVDAMELPHGPFDFIASSHCLEHLANPVAALEHWKSRIKPGGVLFLYLPSEDQRYWRPERCRKHLHSWRPERMAEIVRALGFVDVLHSERDLAWGFAVVGFNGRKLRPGERDGMDGVSGPGHPEGTCDPVESWISGRPTSPEAP